MKKALKIILIILLVLAIGTVVAFPITVSVRGNLSAYQLPDGFNQKLKKAAYSPTDQKTDARLMTYNLLAHYESCGGTDARPRAKMFWAIMAAYKPDVVAVQEMCDQWYCCIRKNEGSYRMIRPFTTGLMLRMTGIIYNSDTLTLLSSGDQAFTEYDDTRMRRIVWAVFETKKTGAKFAVTSTHFNMLRYALEDEDLATMKSQATEQIALTKKLSKDNGCPVFTLGDFNAKESPGGDVTGDSSPVYQMLNTALTDTKNIAKIRSFGAEKTIFNSSNDHIFLYGSATVSEYSLLSADFMAAVSDHFPLFADVRLSAN